MNSRQKRICEIWHQLLLGFAKREWFSVFLSSGLGVLAAEVVELLSRDHSFQNKIIANYVPTVTFDDPRQYVPYLAIIFGTMILGVAAFVSAYFWRGLKSWCVGVTSSLMLLPFASAFLFSLLPSSRFHHRLTLACVTVVFFLHQFCLVLCGEVSRRAVSSRR